MAQELQAPVDRIRNIESLRGLVYILLGPFRIFIGLFCILLGLFCIFAEFEVMMSYTYVRVLPEGLERRVYRGRRLERRVYRGRTGLCSHGGIGHVAWFR